MCIVLRKGPKSHAGERHVREERAKRATEPSLYAAKVDHTPQVPDLQLYNGTSQVDQGTVVHNT